MATFVTNSDGHVPSTPATDERSKRFAAIVWPGMVLGLLGLQVVMCVVAITLATRDPSVAVEPDYYQKALHWDDSQAAKARQAALGWAINVEQGATNEMGETTLRLRLTDKAGQPLAAASVSGEFFHRARANTRASFSANQIELGLYESKLRLGRPGMWEFRVTATREADSATFTKVVELSQLGNLLP